MTTNLYIQIENGKPKGYPVLEENLRYLYSDLDINNLPQGYVKFIKNSNIELNEYYTIDSVEYVLDPNLTSEMGEDIWTEKYNIRELTEEERIEFDKNKVKSMNEAVQQQTGAPYPAPDDGNLYIWAKNLNKWVLKPENFDEVLINFYKKSRELGLLDLSLEELKNIDEDKKEQLKQILSSIDYQNLTDIVIF